MDAAPLLSKLAVPSPPTTPTSSRTRTHHFSSTIMHDDEETGALVPTSAGGGEEVSPAEVKDVEMVRSFADARKVFVKESKVLWAIAAPIAFNILCLYGMNSTTQIFVGHVGNLELSAVAVGLSVVSNFSFGFLLGMGSALETLCGQAFGAGQVSKLGLYMQRSWIILIGSAILLCPLYVFATPILRLLGQDEEIAVAAGKFTLYIIPEMFALAINFPTQKFLQAQSKLGLYMQRSWIILCPLYVFATPILRLISQDEEIAVAAGKFTLYIIPEMFALAINFPTSSKPKARRNFRAGKSIASANISGIIYNVNFLDNPYRLGLSALAALCFRHADPASARPFCSVRSTFSPRRSGVCSARTRRSLLKRRGLRCILFQKCLRWRLIFRLRNTSQAQSKVNVLAWIGFISLLIHVALLGLFIFGLGWGLAGAALAYDISAWIVTISQVIYVTGWCKDGWTGFTWAAFNDLWAFIKLSVASAVMLCLEIWYMMVLVVLTGHLANAEIALDSISICMNINGWEGMLFIGLNAAISVRVSNELGSGRPRATKYAVFVVILQSLMFGIIAMVGILVFRNDFSVIFTNDTELQKAVADIAYLLAVTMVLNSVQPVISGVAIGGGWQGLVAYINLGCYYIFGLPFGFLLGYVFKWGVQGIWAGMLCGTTMQTLILCIIVWRTNWKDEAAEALERIRIWGGDAQEQKLPITDSI